MLIIPHIIPNTVHHILYSKLKCIENKTKFEKYFNIVNDLKWTSRMIEIEIIASGLFVTDFETSFKILNKYSTKEVRGFFDFLFSTFHPEMMFKTFNELGIENFKINNTRVYNIMLESLKEKSKNGHRH